MEQELMLTIFAWLLLALSFWAALVGTFVPGIPGAGMVVVALGVHKWLLPGVYPWWVLWLVLGLALLSWLADLLATALGAKFGGASKWGVLGAVVGGLVGLIYGLPGLVLGSFIGAVAGDYTLRQRELQQLFKAGTGAALGVLISLALRLGILMLMAVVLTVVGLWKLAN
jgi:uncharacterized protein